MISKENIPDNRAPERVLIESVARQDFFASDSTDEFQIGREDGTTQGIFKVWAAPVISQLEAKDPESWARELRDRPLSLFESLEGWRANAAQSDRRLQRVFDEQPLPAETNARIAELFARLTASFAATAPFYHIEALVADNRVEKPDNPIDFNAEASSAGKLDAVAMLLPSAAKDVVVATPGSWNGLNWEKIRGMTANINANPTQFADIHRTLHRVASLASLDVEDVVFAANVLEFIPAQVGGKSTDFPQKEAVSMLNNLMDAPNPATSTTAVAKDMNALIRFLNWTPAVKTDANFEGKNWAYDAVCATAGELLDLVSKNADDVFDGDFGAIFAHNLAPALDGIDATSAKGRFMLQLLHEGRFKPEIMQRINSAVGTRVPELFDVLKNAENDVDFHDFSFVSQVGGKIIGLRTAQQLFGESAVVDSSILPVDAVNKWLKGIDGMDCLLSGLEDAAGDDKDSIARDISNKLWDAQAPNELLASFTKSIRGGESGKIVLRSSSFDEDVDVIGPAPGIYESVVGVQSDNEKEVADAFKTVVASFFSEKAISFRELRGLRHKPVMAVLGQRMIDGPGGSLFAHNGQHTINIAPSPSAINDLGEQNNVQHITVDARPNQAILDTISTVLPANELSRLLACADQAKELFGPIDMEFVLDPDTNRLVILQMRRLERPISEAVDTQIGRAAILPIIGVSDLASVGEDEIVSVRIDASDDVEQFQGSLFKSILSKRSKIARVVIPETLPSTCHFVNILMTLGVTIETA